MEIERWNESRWANGRGESVWVAWFQIVVFSDFASLLREEGGFEELCQALELRVRLLREAIERHAWDGHWYRRAFFDDGSPMGSQENLECQIDSLSQSWAVLADGPSERASEGYQEAVNRLYRVRDKMLLLFTPPFIDTKQDPGYIQGYVAGVRENGGQYTHAAIWMVQAAAKLARGDLAMELFDAINPIQHTLSLDGIAKYKLEPYAIAADVYSNVNHVGRGGWSWYTDPLRGFSELDWSLYWDSRSEVVLLLFILKFRRIGRSSRSKSLLESLSGNSMCC